ncbi:AIG2-like family domain-containing protein [Ditylenchus destructor]|uniref:gamma-glutamylcyclotransferase n=1 Tax=Ditylenchus destructor TaxID=166010 RepID=A0AAD4MHJ4_9BILA|nr:AIG2-like family domain-containing protein [Ditylenchus destructor]
MQPVIFIFTFLFLVNTSYQHALNDKEVPEISSHTSAPGAGTGNTTQLRRNDDGHFYYFAFGSNLLTERIHINIPTAQFVSIGHLQNYTLEFYGNSSIWHGGVASIDRRRGAKVWGCIWKVPNSFASALDRQEHSYRRLDVDITQPLSYHRRNVRCRTYQYKNVEVGKQRPSPRYKHVIVTGAQQHHLPDSYIERLKKIKTNAEVESK